MLSLSRQSVWGTVLLMGATTLCGCKSLPTVTWNKEKTNKEKQEAQKELQEGLAAIQPPEETKNLVPEKPTAKMMVDFAHVKASMEQYSEAGNLFEKAIKTDPKNVDARVGLAKIKMQLGHPDQAIEKLQEGLTRLPKAAPLWNELGIAYTKLEKYPEAIEAIEKAIKFDSETDLYRQNLAGILVVTGEVNKAYKLYAQEMSEADARVQIARILGGQGKMAECRKQIDAAIKADPTNEYALHLSEEIDPQLQPAGYSAPR